MKTALTIIALAIFLVGCGDSQGNGQDNSACESEGGPLSSEPAEKHEDKWLTVEATDKAWLVEGKEVSDDALVSLLRPWAKRVDPELALVGVDDEEISQNPVIFRAKAGISSRRFSDFLMNTIRARMFRIRVHLELTGGEILRRWVILPIDMGLSRDDQPEKFQTGLRIRQKNGTVAYEFSFDGAGWKPAKIGLTKFGNNIEASAYRKLRSKVAEAVADHVVRTDTTISQIEFSSAKGQYPSWALWFAGLDSCLLHDPDYLVIFKFDPSGDPFQKDKSYQGPGKDVRSSMVPPEPEMPPEMPVRFPD